MIQKVVTGADQLLSLEKQVIGGSRIGLLTNPTGITSRFESVVDVCERTSSAALTALFACEHGIRGERQAGVLFEDEVDARLGIPVFSLYGKNKKPTEEMMSVIDAVIFDIQDLGVRFYTYVTTLVYMMEACAEYGKALIVLDRPNPLGGIACEGGMLLEGFESMVGACPMPFRTGMTIGEFARYYNDRLEKPCELRVVPMLHWRRGMEYAATGLPWLMPSPNMPTLDTVRVYAGHCLFEGTNVSEGRGTTRPFEMIGAPWMDGRRVSQCMNGLKLPGVHYHPVTFTPMFSKHQGRLCGGIQAFVTDPESYEAVTSGLHLLHTIVDMYPDDFEWIAPFKEGRKHFIDYLSGSDVVRTGIHTPEGLQRILSLWNGQAKEWERIRQPYLLYGVDE